MTTSSQMKTFFDLHATGLGYVNRIREVPPKGRRGEPFLACTIAALNGPIDKPDYCYFDVRVSGSDAQHLIRRCIDAVDQQRKVLIGFRLGDLWVDPFIYSKGEKMGKPGANLKARLLFISWIKINGEQVYRAESKDESTSNDVPREEAPEPSSEPQDLPEQSNDDAEAPAKVA